MESLFTLLPTKMISKHYINEYKINYEDYLIELLNASPYFMTMTGGEKFEQITQQSHGEADAIANDYALDFKLLVPSEFVNIKLKSLPSTDYSQLNRRVIFINDKSENDGLSQEEANGVFIRFLQLLARSSADQIKSCIGKKDYALYGTINMMTKKKNLFIFLPCDINSSGATNISNIIAKFLASLFSLRDDINQDTFVALPASDNYFYILKYDNKRFFPVDKVPKMFMPTFREIYRLTYLTEKGLR